MTGDPLLSDDIVTLLRCFPNNALRDLVAILKKYTSLSPFPACRAYAAHRLPDDGDFTVHSKEIATELLWWGSHDVRRQFADSPKWKEVLIGTAKHLGIAKHIDDAEQKHQRKPRAWEIEEAIFRKALDDWENLTPEQREAAMKKAGVDMGTAKGAMVVATGGLAQLGAR